MKVITVSKKKTKAETRNQARTANRKAARDEPLVFVGIDTEGSGNGTDHRPVLVSCGTAYLSDAEGLDWERIFAFLYGQFRVGGFVYAGFYLSYDFTQWLRSLPRERAEVLLTPRGRAMRRRRNMDGEFYFPMYVGGWEVDILGMRRLKIRPKGESRWMYICDSGPFFQCSFLRAVDPRKWDDPIIDMPTYERIEEGKEHRSDAVLDDDMVEYQQLEISTFQKLMAALQEGLRDIGVNLTPRQWFGPGQVAQAWLKTTQAPTREELKDIAGIGTFVDAAQATYFGGWFEIFAHGKIPGTSYVYDINSAYPHVIAKLPCLRHGRYSQGHGNPGPGSGSLCIVRGIARSFPSAGSDDFDDRSFRIGSMLHRDSHGRIYRPIATEGYFWQHELDAAIRAGCIAEVEYLEWWKYEPCDCPPPLASVAELYYKRQQVGKNTILGKCIKLLINSIYGKFAQSVGQPKFGNAIYASLVTSGCRTMILDSIATHPVGMSDVLMVATDGICFLHRHPDLPLSGSLGDWEESTHENLCLFKPGMYWDDSDRERIRNEQSVEFKARGINAKDFSPLVEAIDAQYASWPKSTKDLTMRSQWKRKGSGWPTVEFRSHFSMVSVTQAVQDGWDWNKAGSVSDDVTLKQNGWHGEKREGLWYDPTSGIFRSSPRDTTWILSNHVALKSKPYEKRFGVEDPWSLETLELSGITPDGPVSDLIASAMFGSR